jgi:hypothetical protein
MKRIINPLLLIISACLFAGCSAPTPTPIPTQTQTPTATATSTTTATLTNTATQTRRPTRTATPSPTEMPTYNEGEVFPAGDLELRVTTQRAKIVWYLDETLSIKCEQNSFRICLVVKVQVVSGVVASEAWSNWHIYAKKVADIQWTEISGGPKMIRTNPDGNASYGYWVLYVEPDAGDLILQVQETRIVVKDSPILDETSLV